MFKKLQPTSYNLALRALQIGAVELNSKDPFTWASGYRMPIYNDNRKHMSYPENREMIAELVYDIVGAINMPFNSILAVPSGGIWLAAIVAYEYCVPLIVPYKTKSEEGYIIFEYESRQPIGQELRFDAIACSYPRSLPYDTIFAHVNRIPLLYIRPEPKEHGKKNQIEGDLKNIKNVRLHLHTQDMSEEAALEAIKEAGLNLFSSTIKTGSAISPSSTLRYTTDLSGYEPLTVEDLFSSGGSSIKVVEKSKNAGAVADKMIAVFDYGFTTTKIAFEQAGITAYSLLTYRALIEVALEEKFIKSTDVASLAGWSIDPFGWGEANGFPLTQKEKVRSGYKHSTKRPERGISLLSFFIKKILAHNICTRQFNFGKSDSKL